MVAQTESCSNNKDPAIRLFGKKIPLLPAPADGSATHHQSESEEMDQDTVCIQTHKQKHKGWSAANDTSKQEGYCCLVVDEEKVEQSLPDQKTKYSEEKLEANSVQIIKKAEKMLPCPRCKSMDTKFCYYNNYNMKQPRHFCRACQRYWTAGGTMRNVPVGAGRRKNNKNSSSTFSSHYITISSDALRIDPPLLSFGSGAADPNPSTLPGNIFSCWQYPGGHVFYNPTGGFPLLQANYNIQKNYSSSSSSSPKLGKHSREDHYSCLDTHKSPNQKNSSSTVLMPKTLRIDDPNEAAKSSIWETLGIKNESVISGGGIFRGFKSKTTSTDHHGKKRSCVAETSPALLANPAAFSRSITFQETS